MSQKIIDISPRISHKLAVFPGDVPPTRHVAFDLARGDVCTLSELRTTVHAGAHADAPSHYGVGGRTMEQQALDLYWGECEVVKVNNSARMPDNKTHGVRKNDLQVDKEWTPTLSRLLIATGSYADSNTWSPHFLGLDPALVDWLADHGVKLIGIDTPSVDWADSKDLLAHKRFFARDVAIVEGLVLGHVPAGRYELCALPLALEGFDASPVRAALRALA